MSVEFKDLDFDENQPDSVHVELIAGALVYLTADANTVAVDFQEHGVMVEQLVPNGSGGYTRGMTFVPYANLKSITQSYPV